VVEAGEGEARHRPFARPSVRGWKIFLTLDHDLRGLTLACVLRFQGCNTPGSGGVPNPAIPYTGSQPGNVPPRVSRIVTINDQWNGRIFNQNGRCGARGEGCTVLEYNLGKETEHVGVGTSFLFSVSTWLYPF
jgi:hypothetical protein